MKCPNCGYDNSDDLLVCNLCKVVLRTANDQSVAHDKQKIGVQKDNVPKYASDELGSLVLREPILAAVLSFFCLGLGQAYNSERGKGYLFFASTFILGFLCFLLYAALGIPIPKGDAQAMLGTLPGFLMFLCALAVWLYNIYDAYKTANTINGDGVVTESSPGRSVVRFLITIVISFVVLLFLLPFIIMFIVGILRFFGVGRGA